MSAGNALDKVKPLCPRFAEAFLDVDHEVLGFKLKPFSMWHTFLLHHAMCPVMFPGADIAPRDLILAARIGTCGYQEWPKIPKRFSIAGILEEIRIGRADFGKVSQAILAWMEDYSSGPDFWVEQKGASAGNEPHKDHGTMPMQLDAVVRLKDLGWSEKEAWEMSIGRARWYASGQMVIRGAELDFVEPLSPDLERRLREGRAKLAAAKAAKAEAAKSGAGLDGNGASCPTSPKKNGVSTSKSTPAQRARGKPRTT